MNGDSVLTKYGEYGYLLQLVEQDFEQFEADEPYEEDNLAVGRIWNYGPFSKLHLRATEIDDFPPIVITWLKEEVGKREGWRISFMEAWGHPCTTIYKKDIGGETVVKRY